MESTLKQQEITDLINRRIDELDLPDKPEQLYRPVRYTLELGGKRIRPFFTLVSCGICGGELEEAVPAALAMELLHNFTLLHDDIMDAADTRRGKPSVYRKWDASTAILSGDVMFARAFEQLQHYGHSDTYGKKQYATIMDIFLESAETVCEGQAFDLEFAEREDVTVEEYLMMIRGKTAALISGSLLLGGAVAGSDDDALQHMRELGQHAGTAFQIQDDLLDLIADPSKFGKTRGGDILEGKKTYLSVLALSRGNDEQRTFLRKVLSGDDTTQDQVEAVIELYRELGIIDEASDAIERHYRKAHEQLNHFPDSRYRSDLIDYFNKLQNRDY